jgi:hypothetical protein
MGGIEEELETTNQMLSHPQERITSKKIHAHIPTEITGYTSGYYKNLRSLRSRAKHRIWEIEGKFSFKKNPIVGFLQVASTPSLGQTRFLRTPTLARTTRCKRKPSNLADTQKKTPKTQQNPRITYQRFPAHPIFENSHWPQEDQEIQ